MSSVSAPISDRREAIVDGEFAFTSQDFKRIAALLYDLAGISLPDSKATLVYSRLAKRLRSLGMRSFNEYCAFVASEKGHDESQEMLRALTTNVTRFFREPHHFDDLRANVLEPMADQVRAGRRLRLWSAASSSGQEPYSIAFTVLSVWPNAADLDIRILGTDIDTNVLATGRAAVYDESLLEGIPAAARGQYFERDASDRRSWRVCEAARSLVAFRELNLNGPSWPMKGPFDAIFCRNVVIYFDEPTQERVWNRFAPLVAPGGRLYVGHSERVGTSVTAFESCGLTAYRKVGR
ncbi:MULTISPECIES: protein-glutamate O-methyltransferase CheR [unclassified Caulobacter]|jgi:chemotaxis protein methyltransferase CheR|uniref:CheR family methyltransferase n=1 Tax=unclassified Caulobacter TaxID=2648921 RepID=UPI00078369B3|nr:MULTISPECIES: protein-glutamate O-methyltransferase CheR [unclassified Caulobacter]AZS19788.1 protein-glutamate O-methyltransferase CheR [Caulobacter sp. FWC26]